MNVKLSAAAWGAALALAATVPGGAQDTGGNMRHAHGAMMMGAPCHGIRLSAVGGSGENGCATVRGGNGVVFVAISVNGEPAGASQPSHVHRGQCGSNGPIVIPLANVVGGSSANSIPYAKWSRVSRGGYYINIHRSARALGVIVACGNIMPSAM